MSNVVNLTSVSKARGLKPQPRKIKALEVKLGKRKRIIPARSFAFQMNEAGQITVFLMSDLPMVEFTKLFRAGMHHEYVSHFMDCACSDIEVRAIFEENV